MAKVKKIVKSIGIVLLAIVVLVCAFFAYLTVTALNPKREAATLTTGTNSNNTIEIGEEFSVLSWNIGYCALGEESSFFMDGGDEVRPESKNVIEKNLAGVTGYLKGINADFMCIQEVDSGSKRSYKIMETDSLINGFGYDSSYALNYKCNYVPFPWPTIGKVSSGIMTMSTLPIESTQRIALPSPFKWPVSTANLKRCLDASFINLEGTDKQLVLINLHLEAYDDGEGKAAQTKVLLDFVQEQYEKGNYVIACGDWNQTFPGGLDSFPIKDAELWTPGTLDNSILPEGWNFAYDTTVPTCRLLNQPYDAQSDATQYYVIDGYLLSPNVKVESIETQNLDFEFSDHNPVLLKASLVEE